jgi:hypothetical protein
MVISSESVNQTAGMPSSFVEHPPAFTAADPVDEMHSNNLGSAANYLLRGADAQLQLALRLAAKPRPD